MQEYAARFLHRNVVMEGDDVATERECRFYGREPTAAEKARTALKIAGLAALKALLQQNAA